MSTSTYNSPVTPAKHQNNPAIRVLKLAAGITVYVAAIYLAKYLVASFSPNHSPANFNTSVLTFPLNSSPALSSDISIIMVFGLTWVMCATAIKKLIKVATGVRL